MVNGEKIRALMKERGIQAKEMAMQVGISEAMMSYIIRGLRETNVAVLVRIARILDVSVDDLIKKEA